MKNYALKYTMQPDTNNGKGFTKKEVLAFQEECEGSNNFGFTDALFCTSIIRDEDGSLSHCFFSKDPNSEDGQVSILEIFKIWGSLAHELSQDDSLSLSNRNICNTALNMIRMSIGLKPREFYGAETDESEEKS